MNGHRVALLGRENCPACEQAEADIKRICGELGIEYTVSDVDGDSELRAEYGDRVPVIMVDGAEHGYWAVEEDRLRSALA